jgi:hypothetical protein
MTMFILCLCQRLEIKKSVLYFRKTKTSNAYCLAMSKCSGG